MSEGKKVLVVVEDLDRMILQDQLEALRIDVDVIVDREAAGAVVNSLLNLPSKREEMLKIIEETSYKGSYYEASAVLVQRIKEEIQKFKAIYSNSVALQDMLAKLLQEELKPYNEDWSSLTSPKGFYSSPIGSALDTGHDITVNLLAEMLNELKGIKTAVTTPESSSEGSDELSEDQNRFGITAPESRAVTSKEKAITELTKILKGEPGTGQFLPSYLLFGLPAKDREEIIRLLNPKVNFVVGDGSDNTVSFGGPDAIIEVLLASLREEVPSDVHFYGLSSLRAQDREILIDKLELGLGKYNIKVAGGTKRSFLEGLVNVLQEESTLGNRVVINGVGVLNETDTTDLIGLFKLGLEGTAEFIGHKANTRNMLEKLIEVVAGDETNTVTIHDLKRIDGRAKRNLTTALKHALKKYEELVVSDRKLVVEGVKEAVSPGSHRGSVNYTDVSLTLLQLSTKLATEAGIKGISIDDVDLHAYLLTKAVTAPRNNPTPDQPAAWSVLTQKLTEGMTTGLVVGNQVFDLTKREDGSIRIVTGQGGSNSSSLILNQDGSIKFERTLSSSQSEK